MTIRRTLFLLAAAALALPAGAAAQDRHTS
jgi:hypothetical protein